MMEQVNTAFWRTDCTIAALLVTRSRRGDVNGR
jgi:hypothetical protein